MDSAQPIGLTNTLVRLGGLCGVAAGLLAALSYILHPSNIAPADVGNGRWLVVHGGFLISIGAGVFLLIALLGKYLRETSASMWGIAGAILAIISMLLFGGVAYTELFVLPVIARDAPGFVARHGVAEMWPASPIQSPLLAIPYVCGFILFCWHLSKATVISNVAAWLTIAGVLGVAAGMSGYFPDVVLRIGACVFGAGVLAIGVGLLSTRKSANA